MATLKISLSLSNRDTATLVRLQAARDTRNLLNRISNLLIGVTSGAERPATVGIQVLESGTQATGTCTFVTVANNSTVTVGGVVFTGKTSAPSGIAQFLCGVSASADAAAFVAIFNAHTSNNLSGLITAAAVAGVVTFTTADYSYAANQFSLASSDGTNLAVSAARVTGGVLDAALLSFSL